ncbi:MAG: phenylacetate--CoA ligase [Syntrophotaleaceae bacterium]
MYWEPEVEGMPRQELRGLQLERLRETMELAVRAPFYRRQLADSGLMQKGLKDIDDIRRLPFTTKDDLRGNFPYGFLTCPKEGAVRLHCSSGTTGNPTVIFHDSHDLASWANLVARSLYCAGVRDTDVFQNICGYGLFTGGLGFQNGAERLGALVIPAAAGNTRRQVKLMQDFGTTVVHTIPSYLFRLHAAFGELGLDPRKDTELRLFVIGAEPHTEGQRRRIEELFGIRAYNSYGLSEMNGPGVAFECEEQNGLHVWEDCFVAEIIDPRTLEPVPDGEEGELVMTTLDRRAMPLIRYRTRDLTRILPEPCPCGRTHRRLARISGRSDDMFIVKGCNVFPMQIEQVLMRFREVGTDYLIVLETRHESDEITIQVEVQKDGFTGDMADLENLSRKIAHEIRDEILVTPTIRLVEPGSLPKSEGKAVRVEDRRIRQESL